MTFHINIHDKNEGGTYLPRIKGHPDKYRIDVRLSKDIFQRLDEKRRAEGYVTISELLRYLIRKYLEEGEG